MAKSRKWLPKDQARQNKARKRRRLQSIVDISIRCQLCGTYANLELDHIVPRKKVGCTKRYPEPHNRMVLCGTCNLMKGDMYPSELLEHLRRLGARDAEVRFIENLNNSKVRGFNEK